MRRCTLLLLVTIFWTGCATDSQTETDPGSENQTPAGDAAIAERGKASRGAAATQGDPAEVVDDRVEDKNKLRQVALSMLNYEAAHKKFPMAAMGNGMLSKDLSWRVVVLPYLELNDEYGKFDLGQAWDSAQNKPLVDGKAAQVFELGNGSLVCAIQHETPPATFSQIPDGTSNTVAFIENPAVDTSQWTSPVDIDVQAAVELVKSLEKGEYLLAAMFDGSVKQIYSPAGRGIKDEEIRALFDYRDGTVINRLIFIPARD